MNFSEKLALINELEQKGISLTDVNDINEYREYLNEQELRVANPADVEALRTTTAKVLPIEVYFNKSFFGFDSYADFVSVAKDAAWALSSIDNTDIETGHVHDTIYQWIIKNTRFLVYKTPSDISAAANYERKPREVMEEGDFEDILMGAYEAGDDEELPSDLAVKTTTKKFMDGVITQDHPDFMRFTILAKALYCEELDIDPDANIIRMEMQTISKIEF